jgi:hypothetical protein
MGGLTGGHASTPTRIFASVGGVGEGPPIGWKLSVYPAAGEAGGSFQQGPRQLVSRRHGPTDPERAAEEAARRAKSKVRRYCSSNRLNRLGTLTYAGEGCHDPRELRVHVGEFFRSLRTGTGGRPLPYLWTAEWHKSGHGLHVHFAVGRYIRRSLINESWGRGFVHIKLLGALPVGSGPLEEARRAAGYLSKYISKSFDEDRVPGLHRYEVAQGFQPDRVRVWGRTCHNAIQAASELMGSQPQQVWNSEDVDDWGSKPPAVWVQWRG